MPGHGPDVNLQIKHTRDIGKLITVQNSTNSTG
jgi:hypothetical protein